MNNLIEKTKLVEVAAAVLQRPDGSFLLAQRPADKIWAGYWEFPGGKVEHGETPHHALVRELREELGIEVETAYPWVTRVFTYPHATVQLNFFRVTKWSGELHPHEGQQFAWQGQQFAWQGQQQRPLFLALSMNRMPKGVLPYAPTDARSVGAYGNTPDRTTHHTQAHGIQFGRKIDDCGLTHKGEREQVGDYVSVSPILPANTPILRALELPPLYAISNVGELGAEEFMRRLEGALHNGLRLVQMREKNLPPAEMRTLSLRVLELAHTHGAQVLINGDVELAREIGADGVHLNSAQLAACGARPDVPWCAASCHNKEELQHAAELGLDFAVLGPVLPTKSHPGAAHLGWEAFGEIAAGSAIPVYALGGLCRNDMETAWQHGAHGIALLRQAWRGVSSSGLFSSCGMR